jgi:uncharacterized LabA/DUF88 family protein
MIERKPRVALLIDADNAPAAKIDLILSELSTFGETNIRRAYGNWKKAELKGWEEVLHEHAIRPMQQFDYSKGKNASDMAMIIDALELLYTDRPEAFGIVSSDADFTPLVMHLRAKGAAVYGFGAKKTPEPFVNACSRFLYLDQLTANGAEASDAAEAAEAGDAPAVPATPLKVPSSQLRQNARLVSLLRNAVNAARDESGWARVGTVGQQIANQASLDPRNYGYASLTKLMAATQLFEWAGEGTSQVAVRDKREAAKAAKGG